MNKYYRFMHHFKKISDFLKNRGIEFTAVIIAILFFLRIPSTIQSGDTGELISAAFGNYVPHPPGYPLFTWLQALFTHVLAIGSVYWRASLLNALLSVACLYVLGALLKENKLVAIGSMLLLAFSRVFWKYSLLPDVFILNALFAVLILALFLKENLSSHRALWIPFLFCVGLTNHLTLVFLLPLVLVVLFQQRAKKALYAVMALGIAIFFLLYGSLILKNPDSVHSWGNVTNFRELVSHFLRKDYGTFQLVNSLETSSSLAIWKYFGKETLLAFFVLVITCLGLAFKSIRSSQVLTKKGLLVATTLLLYPLVFFSLSNMELRGFRTEVIERFFILAHVLFVVAAGYFTVKFSQTLSRKMQRAIGSAFIISALLSFALNQAENDYSKNTAIEEYIVNLLNEAPATPTILLIHSDTRYFGVRYAQSVLGVRPDVKVATPKLFFFPWFTEKFVKDTGIEFDSKRILETQKMSLESDLVLNNLERYSFLTLFDFINTDAYHVQFLPIGRLLTKGTGAEIYSGNTIHFSFNFKNKDLAVPNERYTVFRDVWSDYCAYPLLAGRGQAMSGNVALGVQVMQKALSEFPWCLRVAEEICTWNKDPNCPQQIEKIKSEYYPYWTL